MQVKRPTNPTQLERMLKEPRDPTAYICTRSAYQDIVSWTNAPDTFVLRWDEAPDETACKKARVVHLDIGFDEQPPGNTPPSLLRLYSAESLVVPASLCPALDPRGIPSSVTELTVQDIGSDRAEFPASARYPTISRLSVDTRKTNANSSMFPNVRMLYIRIHLVSGLRALEGFDGLWGLDVSPLKSFTRLENVRIEDLVYLGISGGSVPHLDGIERAGKLMKMRLHNLTRLVDLSALSALNDLDSISFLYCPQLSDVEPLLSLPSLRKIEFTSCKHVDVGRLKRLAANRGSRIEIQSSGRVAGE